MFVFLYKNNPKQTKVFDNFFESLQFAIIYQKYSSGKTLKIMAEEKMH